MGGIAVEVDSPPPYGVLGGSDCLNSSLMSPLRLAHICRRRMMRSLAFGCQGCVSTVEALC